ncbi:MAG: MmgE/PrpD family protein [Deltaproteobacteria bacterium]|nr:MmgE/PrpD family protein [Deltaproteobacteria bacterium]
MARDLIKAEELGIPAEKGATLFCDGAKVTPMGAAFANAALFHGRAQEDTLGSSHTGTVITPAVLALAERDGYTGKQVLEAVIAGYEIVGALDRAVSGYTTPRGFRASPIFGIFGSASAAGKLLGLSEEETIKAIGFAAAFAGGTLECFAAGTMEWRFEVGVASREGILAALLAKQGAVSAPTAMEGDAGFLRAFADTTEGSESISRDLGKTWSIMSTGFKPYPVCAFNQTPVRIILGILEENDISHEDIEKVVVMASPGTMIPG